MNVVSISGSAIHDAALFEAVCRAADEIIAERFDWSTVQLVGDGRAGAGHAVTVLGQLHQVKTSVAFPYKFKGTYVGPAQAVALNSEHKYLSMALGRDTLKELLNLPVSSAKAELVIVFGKEDQPPDEWVKTQARVKVYVPLALMEARKIQLRASAH